MFEVKVRSMRRKGASESRLFNHWESHPRHAPLEFGGEALLKEELKEEWQTQLSMVEPPKELREE